MMLCRNCHRDKSSIFKRMSNMTSFFVMHISYQYLHRFIKTTSGIPMEDYAIRRREYVQQVRASFDQPAEEKYHNYTYPRAEAEEEPIDTTFLGLKLRLTIAIILFCIIFFCKYNSYPIFGMEITEIIDMISDNQYYTFLQTYVKM